MTWRVDLVKDGDQRPLVVDIPTEGQARELVVLASDHGGDVWDKLVAVEDNEIVTRKESPWTHQ